jgi:hypothetical protein
MGRSRATLEKGERLAEKWVTHCLEAAEWHNEMPDAHDLCRTRGTAEFCRC